MKNPAIMGGINVDAVTGTSASGAITLNCDAFNITTESLNTAAAAEYVLTMTNARVGVDSIVMYTCGKGSATQGTLLPGNATTSAGSVILTMTNVHASEAVNGTMKIKGFIINPR